MVRVAVPTSQYRHPAFSRAFTLTSGLVYRNETINSDVLALAVDVHKPAISGRPMVGVLHGGGFRAATRTTNPQGYVEPLIRDLGFVAVAIDYCTADPAVGATHWSGAYQVDGITPVNTHNYAPDLEADVRAAVQWMRTNAASYGGDPNRVALWGMSAGATLALQAAAKGTAGADRPDAVIAWSPPCQFDGFSNQHTGTDAYSIIPVYVGEPWNPTDATHKAADPAYQAWAGNPCPIRLTGSASESEGTGGVPASHVDTLNTLLAGAGLDVTRITIAGTQHADFRGTDLAQSFNWLLGKLGSQAWSSARGAAGTRPVAGARRVA